MSPLDPARYRRVPPQQHPDPSQAFPAMKLSPENLELVAEWTGGRIEGARVEGIVGSIGTRIEFSLGVGDWVARRPDGFFWGQTGDAFEQSYAREEPETERERRLIPRYLPRELVSDPDAAVALLEHLGIVWVRGHWCAGSGTSRAVCGCG